MGILKIKAGVRLRGLSPHAVLGLIACAQVFFHHGKDCIVTSVTDGDHSVGSLHYTGEAFDLRRRHLSIVKLQQVVSTINRALNNEWDVVVESTHIHVEYDPT